MFIRCNKNRSTLKESNSFYILNSHIVLTIFEPKYSINEPVLWVICLKQLILSLPWETSYDRFDCITEMRLLDGAMVLGKLPVSGCPTNLDNKRAWAYCALGAGAGGGCMDIFLSSIISLFFLPLWETARYKLKYCLKR